MYRTRVKEIKEQKTDKSHYHRIKCNFQNEVVFVVYYTVILNIEQCCVLFVFGKLEFFCKKILVE